ncbi:MAG: hypothetical protein GC165_01455 [Armatimonadetes bacterium]|nr:hypothetical protein [Armatimonadota bacterium]
MQESYSVLYDDGRRVLQKFLLSRGVSEDESDEIVQNLFVGILNHWSRLQFNSASAWYGYLYESCRNGIRHAAKNPNPSSPLRETEDHRIDVHGIIAKVLDRERLYSVADEVWLGVEPEDGHKRCLAAQLHFIDGLSPEEALKVVAAGQPPPIQPDDFLEWISSPWVLRKVAFNELYISSDRLCAEILGLESWSNDEFDRIWLHAKRNDPELVAIGDWTCIEVDFILMRYRAGIPFSLALAKTAKPLSRERGLEIHDRCRSRYPFVKKMINLWGRTEGIPFRDQALGANSLWKRLVFQYYVLHELPQDDILERISPAADVAGYRIRNINTWIANRLLDDILSWRAKNDG